MWQDVVAEWVRAPGWARAGMVLFVVIAILMIFGPPLEAARYRRRFRALAAALGAPVKTPRDAPMSFSVSRDGRAFDVTYELKGGGRGSSYRGPRGHVLTTATTLASPRWSMHQVDVVGASRRLAWFGAVKRHQTGDAAFDARLLVLDEGLSVRDGWLDADAREALLRFADAAPVAGPLWIREGRVLYLMSEWRGLDPPALQALLQQQAALTAALDRAAGPRA